MFLVDSFFSRISGDFRQRELLPLKLLFFVHSSTMYVLYPYLTIHMRELGINVEETAIMSAVTPIVAIIMPPLAGIVADRIGNFKIILSLLSGLGGAASLLLLLVPVGRITVTFPNITMLEVNTSQGLIDLTIPELYPCNRYKNDSLTVNLKLEGCGLVCNRKADGFIPYGQGPKTVDEENTAILGTRNYTIIVKSNNGTDSYQYILGPADLPLYKIPIDFDVRNGRVMSNKGHFSTSVRKLTPTRYFFPATGLSSFDCTGENETITCSIIIKDDQVPQQIIPQAKFFTVKLNNSLESHFYISNMKPDFDNLTSWKLFETNGADTGFEKKLSVDIPLPNVDNGLEIDATLTLENCVPRCLATIPRVNLCSNQDKITEFDVSLTFWLYLVIRVFIGMISGTSFAMFEGAVIAILREHKADYGLQRIYATIGGMISSPLSGWLIDYASKDKYYTDFRPAFYLYAAMKMLSSVLMLTINLEFKSPSKNVLKDVVSVLKKVEIIALLITCFILGTAWGYIENFLFWFLQDLGASRSLMGITITVGGIAGLPLLVMSGPIIAKIGHANVLFIGFIFYAIRLMGYSLIYNPWMCLIFEAMESVTSSLAFTAAVTYAAKLSSMTTDSSIQGLLGGLYFGVGKGAGSLIGGYLMEAIGIRPTYQVFSAVTLLTGIIYFLFNHFLISRHTEEHKEKKKNMKEANGAITATEIPTKQKEAENIPMSTVINQKNKYNSNSADSSTKKVEGTINQGFNMKDEVSSLSEKS